MKKFALIIPPVIWQKLPLPGIGYILENLQRNNIKTYLFDINIEIYNKLKTNKHICNKWTINYNNFTNQFYEFILKNQKDHLFNVIYFIKKQKIKYAGFSVYKTNFLFSLNFAKLLKEEVPNIQIIFGGPHIAYLNYYNPGYLNQNFIDYFVMGEGEETLLDILNNKIHNKITISQQIKNLNQIHFPKYKQFNLSLYERKNSLPILLSRGCINKCNFCFERILFNKYTIRQPEQVIEEIKYHIKTNKIRWFTFYDSLFNGSLNYLEKFLRLINKHKLKFIWDAQIGIRDDMDNNLMQLMKKSGCINLCIGLESGSDYILKQMNKNFSTSQAERFFKKLIKNNINFEISLIVNYPYEDQDNFNETIQFLLKNKKYIKKIAQINPYIYYPRTEVDITMGYNFLKGLQKVNQLIKILNNENMKYTNAYINNLTV